MEMATALYTQQRNLNNLYQQAVLLFDPDLKLTDLKPPQERLLQATRDYAGGWAETMGFADIAEDIQKHYGISKGIQNHIDELTPKPQAKKRSYDHGLG